MDLLVYQLAHSPYCIPITTALQSCGTAFDTREVPNWDRGEVIRLTGGVSYQVPLLVHGGAPIFETAPDSQNIARYVNEKFAGGRLFPARLEGLQAIVIEHLEDKVEGVTFRLVDPFYLDQIKDLVGRTMTLRHKERKFGSGCVEQWRANAGPLRAEADRLLVPYESTLRHTPFLLGEAPVYADFLLYGVLGNMTWNGWNQLSSQQSALAEWRERLQSFRFA